MIHQYLKYAVTGIDRSGKRFSLLYSGKGGYRTAMGINLFKGSVWEIYKGKRKLIKRVFN